MAEATNMIKTIKQLEEIKLVGFRVLCSGDQYITEIPKASLSLSERINEIKQVVNPLLQYGAFVVDNQTTEDDGYWVCVEVKEYEDIPSDMVTITVPPQRYAVSRHKGANYQIVNWYEELHNWIVANNYSRLKEKWHLEKFYSWNDTENLDVELFDTIK
ncbi:GyrI-like domain-containing protein [Aquibacillus koreensis]|uniref:GyrI-like domain-containing protein n=1 Tax=Aquibacillus koreensis TaxID=279446 RepID=A0A9X3WIF0_9BACI|nr:GyrI-like domain-containing protein [Aquibacillus koreensis]MCT2534856.1 GyrI-like domain-containing protein [Aquibacillus koreensis]MDC3419533.1 GyrI-like domain-containing protein [Aquibacillus koreensis]